MGISYQPTQQGDPTPQEKARVQANVAIMRAQGAPESEVLSYLQYESGAPQPTNPSAQTSGLDPQLEQAMKKYRAARASDDQIRALYSAWTTHANAAAGGNSDADFWEGLTKAGINPDSATAIVQSHAGMNDADLWERLTQNGAAPDAATALVRSRSGVLAQNTGTPPNTDINLRNLVRSFVQGSTYGFGDELGLTDRAKQKAFQAAHPIPDFLLKIAGGALAPAVAVAAAPEALAGLGGAAMLGGAVGGLDAAGNADPEPNAPSIPITTPIGMFSLSPRIAAAIPGAVGGMFGGVAGYGATKAVSKVASPIVSKVMDLRNPSRAVARAAQGVIDNPTAVATRMSMINDLAPGGSSVASASVTPGANAQSRMTALAQGIGASPAAGAQSEADLLGQQAALRQGMQDVGDKMQAIKVDVPMSTKLRTAMDKVRNALGGKTPELPENDTYMVAGPRTEIPATTAQSPAPDLRQAISDFWARPGIAFDRKDGTVAQQMARTALERHGAEDGAVMPGLFGSPATELPAEYAPETVDVHTLRDALSRLRFMGRQIDKGGLNANGLTKNDVNDATRALTAQIYKHAPDFEPLDAQYGALANEGRSVAKLLKTVQASRQSYAGSDAYGASASSVGGIPSGAPGIIRGLFDGLLQNKPGAADAVANLVMKPGGPDAVRNLLSKAPSAGTPKITPAIRAGIFSALPPAMKGLLFQPQEP